MRYGARMLVPIVRRTAVAREDGRGVSSRFVLMTQECPLCIALLENRSVAAFLVIFWFL